MDSLCAICHSNKFIYTCPACHVKTCSLECIKRHKKQTECTGTVDQSRFIPKKHLAETPVHINRDYNFLMKMGRDIQVGKTDIKSNAKNVFKRGNNSAYNRNKRFKPDSNSDPRLELVNQCFPASTNISIKRMNTMVVMLPEGMSRSSNNKTGYDKKLQTFTWTVQWVFTDQDGLVIKDFLSYRINENSTLKDAVPMNVLTGLREDIKSEQLKFYLQNIIRFDLAKQTYIPLALDLLLTEALKDTVVLEYPTIHVTTKDYPNLISKEAAYLKNPSEESSSSSSESDSSSDSSSDSDSDSSDNEETSDEAPEEHSSRNNNESKEEAVKEEPAKEDSTKEGPVKENSTKNDTTHNSL